MLVKAFELIFTEILALVQSLFSGKCSQKQSLIRALPLHRIMLLSLVQMLKVKKLGFLAQNLNFYKIRKKPIKSSSSVPRIKCVSCRIVIHESCRDQLFEEKQKIMCRPTYKEPLGTQSKFNSKSLCVEHRT